MEKRFQILIITLQLLLSITSTLLLIPYTAVMVAAFHKSERKSEVKSLPLSIWLQMGRYPSIFNLKFVNVNLGNRIHEWGIHQMPMKTWILTIYGAQNCRRTNRVLANRCKTFFWDKWYFKDAGIQYRCNDRWTNVKSKYQHFNNVYCTPVCDRNEHPYRQHRYTCRNCCENSHDSHAACIRIEN